MADEPATPPVEEKPAPAAGEAPAGYKWADDVSGVKILVPEDKFETFVASRDAKKKAAKGDVSGVEERLATLESSLRKEAEEKARAEFESELEELKKNNNVEELRKVLEKKHQEQLQTVAKERDALNQKIVEADIKGAFRKVDGFIPDLEEDAMILYRTKFDVDDGFVKDKASGSYLLSDSGEKLSVAEHVQAFLKSKPQFLAASHSPSSGAVGTKGADSVEEMTNDAYIAIQEKGGIEARELSKRAGEGKLKII